MENDVRLEKEEIQESIPDIFEGSKLFRMIIADSKLRREQLIEKNIERMALLKKERGK